jgi:hypothetical protein
MNVQSDIVLLNYAQFLNDGMLTNDPIRAFDYLIRSTCHYSESATRSKSPHGHSPCRKH